MKRLIIILIFFSSAMFFAQNSSEAKELLNEVSTKVKGYDNVSIDFKYVLNNIEENIKQETRGDVVMQGEKYVLNILGITQMYDGSKLFSISPEDEEVTISNEDMDDENTITPSKMFSFYENGFTYDMDIEQNVKGRKIQYVKLVPISSDSEIEYILLGIDSQTKHVYNLIEIGKNGTKTTLTVNSFKTNEQLSKSLFTFDKSKYKDYYINELD